MRADGSEVWTRSLGGVKEQRAFDMTEAPDGGFVVAGTTTSDPRNGVDMLIMKVNQEGVL